MAEHEDVEFVMSQVKLAALYRAADARVAVDLLITPVAQVALVADRLQPDQYLAPAAQGRG